MNDTSAHLNDLNRQLDSAWEDLFKGSLFLSTIEQGPVTKSLYAMYLIETYHYTKHNAKNQALVGSILPIEDTQYLKFCFQHAAEETGHELMAYHDLKSVLKMSEIDLPGPLPSTEVLVAYLYWISSHGNPLQRLGYSFWAESCYKYIGRLLKKVQTDLSLDPHHMTFFISHAHIDVEHAREVEQMLIRGCKKPGDWQDVATVMLTTLRLTGAMMDEVHAEHQKFMNNTSNRYPFLQEAS